MELCAAQRNVIRFDALESDLFGIFTRGSHQAIQSRKVLVAGDNPSAI